MSKLDRIRHFWMKIAGLAIVSDPVTCQLSYWFWLWPTWTPNVPLRLRKSWACPLVPALEVASLLYSTSQYLLRPENPWQNQGWPSKYRQPYYLCRVWQSQCDLSPRIANALDVKLESLTPFIQKCALSSQLMKFKNDCCQIMLIKLLILVSTIFLFSYWNRHHCLNRIWHQTLGL